eukprot:CAMPEP_0117522464 /NCGR_PEP_ID=MMETSP0784-20121206/34221_1 /TAXON_ID=39447 /ORGANISM="" /LENGTH=79 /DNA_ID=CAMNT_0005318537 /DNA_START=87 /DNA_END=322 /DNA_ORIENTATION=-
MLLALSGSSSLGSGYGMLTDVALSSALWTLLQVILFQVPDLSAYNLNRAHELDFRNRMVSFTHGIFAVALSLYSVLARG